MQLLANFCAKILKTCDACALNWCVFIAPCPAQGSFARFAKGAMKRAQANFRELLEFVHGKFVKERLPTPCRSAI